MTEREKLILHLQNLLKSNKKTATIDVTFLLEILNALPESARPAKQVPLQVSIDVDGGTFTE